MKLSTKERKQRLSLLLLSAGAVLALLIVTALIVSIIIWILVDRGMLQLGSTPLNGGKLLLNLVLWSILIGGIFTFISMRIPLKPINKILNSIKHLSEGDYSTRLQFRGLLSRHPAVVELTDSFNKMASELEQTELLRSDFINNFSHEFKTPIVSITGFARLLKRSNLSEEKRTEYLDAIEEESVRLSQLATNILNLTNVENQSILTNIEHFNLSEQIRVAALMLEGKWTRKHIDLLLPSEEFFASGNADLLEQVWINLFDNAIKFSPEYGIIDIQINRSADRISIFVSNIGDAIPAESMDKIFIKFYQADESHSTEGNGVGLAVVKKIIELHNGEITVHCSEGKTTFTVVLPLQSDPENNNV